MLIDLSPAQLDELLDWPRIPTPEPRRAPGEAR